MFNYKQRPPSKEFSKGYGGINWDKEDVIFMPTLEVSREEFEEMYPSKIEVRHEKVTSEDIEKAADIFNNAPFSDKNRIIYTKYGRFETDDNGELK